MNLKLLFYFYHNDVYLYKLVPNNYKIDYLVFI